MKVATKLLTKFAAFDEEKAALLSHQEIIRGVLADAEQRRREAFKGFRETPPDFVTVFGFTENEASGYCWAVHSAFGYLMAQILPNSEGGESHEMIRLPDNYEEYLPMELFLDAFPGVQFHPILPPTGKTAKDIIWEDLP